MESKNTSHLISTILPSRLNRSFLQIQLNLNKLKTLAPSNISTSINDRIVCLTDLYILVDELIGSSQTQKVNLQSRNKALIEDALSKSTRLIDSYSNLMELLAQMKGNVRVLQFALRRKGIDTYSTTVSHLLDYFLSRKKAKKNIVGCLRSLEQTERETGSYLVAGEDNHHVIEIVREMVIVTISVFHNVLLILLGKPKLDKGFSWITKLMSTRKPSSNTIHEIVNDTNTHIIDLTLDSLWKDIKKNPYKTVEVQMVMERLHKLNYQIEGYEVGLDSLFRKLIQTRVSLLNILAT